MSRTTTTTTERIGPARRNSWSPGSNEQNEPLISPEDTRRKPRRNTRSTLIGYDRRSVAREAVSKLSFSILNHGKRNCDKSYGPSNTSGTLSDEHHVGAQQGLEEQSERQNTEPDPLPEVTGVGHHNSFVSDRGTTKHDSLVTDDGTTLGDGIPGYSQQLPGRHAAHSSAVITECAMDEYGYISEDADRITQPLGPEGLPPITDDIEGERVGLMSSGFEAPTIEPESTSPVSRSPKSEDGACEEDSHSNNRGELVDHDRALTLETEGSQDEEQVNPEASTEVITGEDKSSEEEEADGENDSSSPESKDNGEKGQGSPTINTGELVGEDGRDEEQSNHKAYAEEVAGYDSPSEAQADGKPIPSSLGSEASQKEEENTPRINTEEVVGEDSRSVLEIHNSSGTATNGEGMPAVASEKDASSHTAQVSKMSDPQTSPPKLSPSETTQDADNGLRWKPPGPSKLSTVHYPSSDSILLQAEIRHINRDRQPDPYIASLGSGRRASPRWTTFVEDEYKGARGHKSETPKGEAMNEISKLFTVSSAWNHATSTSEPVEAGTLHRKATSDNITGKTEPKGDDYYQGTFGRSGSEHGKLEKLGKEDASAILDEKRQKNYETNPQALRLALNTVLEGKADPAVKSLVRYLENALDKQKGELKRLKEHIESQEEANEQRGELERLKKQMQENENVVGRFKQQVGHERRQNRELQAQLESLKNEMARSEKLIADMKSKTSAMEKGIESSEEDRQVREKELRSLRDRIAELERHGIDHDQLKNLQGRVKQLETQNKHLAEQLAIERNKGEEDYKTDERILRERILELELNLNEAKSRLRMHAEFAQTTAPPTAPQPKPPINEEDKARKLQSMLISLPPLTPRIQRNHPRPQPRYKSAEETADREAKIAGVRHRRQEALDMEMADLREIDAYRVHELWTRYGWRPGGMRYRECRAVGMEERWGVRVDKLNRVRRVVRTGEGRGRWVVEGWDEVLGETY